MILSAFGLVAVSGQLANIPILVPQEVKWDIYSFSFDII